MDLLLNLILLALSVTLPGIVLAKKFARDYHELNLADLFILAIALSLIHLCFFGITAVILQVFTVKLIWSCQIGVTIFYLIYFRRELFPLSPVLSDWKPLTLYLLVVFLAYNTFPKPAPWMSNYHMDAGRYSNTASFLLTNQRLEISYPETLTKFLDPKTDLAPFPGYYRSKDHPDHTFTPPFVHLYPMLLAFVRDHLGIVHSFQLNWILGIFSASFFYLLLKLLTQQTSLSLALSLILFSNPACQLFFNRNMSETLSQALVHSTFIVLTLLQRNGSRMLGIFAALSLFLLATTRIEFGILYALVPLIYTITFFLSDEKPSQHYWIFLLTHFLFLGVIDYYYSTIGFNYVLTNSRSAFRLFSFASDPTFSHIKPWFIHLWVGANGVLLLINFALTSFCPRLFNAPIFTAAQARRACSLIIITGYAAFLIWNLFIRPTGSTVPNPLFRAGYNHNTINLLRLSSFIDLATIGLGIFGVATLMKSSRGRAFGLFAIISVVLLILKSNHSAPVLWWIRRYMPTVIPGLYFLGGLGMMRLGKVAQGMFLLFALIFNILGTSISIRSIEEKPGMYQFYQELSSLYDHQALQLCFGGDDCNHAAVPLQSHFQIDTLYLTPGLNSSKVNLIANVIKERPLYVIHSALTRSPFSPADEQLLHEAGLSLSLVTSRKYTAPEPQALVGWKKGEPWTKLFLPRTLQGVRFRTQGFPVKIFRLSY